MLAERHVSVHRHEEALLLTASGPALLEAILARLKGAEDRMAAAMCRAVLCRAVLCCVYCSFTSHMCLCQRHTWLWDKAMQHSYMHNHKQS